MKNLILPVAILGILGSTACNKSAGCDEAYTTSTFKLNTKYCINDHTHMTIDSIKDSRCPIDAVCVWAGEAVIYMTLFDEDVYTQNIIRFQPTPKTQTFDNLSLDWIKMSIDEVGPYPTAEIFKAEDYYIKMKVENK